MSLSDKSNNGMKNAETDGGTEKFLHLWTLIQGRVYAYILSHWPNRSDADDIMQETISIMWKKYDTYQPGSDFLAWAITIAKYVLLTFRKKQNNNQIKFNDEELRLIEEKSEEFINTVDGRLEILEVCVKKLPKKDTNLLKLKYNNELSAQTIAIRFGMSVRTVYRSLAKIYTLLMRCMNQSLEGGKL
jgi:RNA polymerase sigma-70 factor (ECF subfamily)